MYFEVHYRGNLTHVARIKDIIYAHLAKNVVGSDGANSKIRKLVAKKSPKKYLAIQEWYSAADENSFYTCIFDKSFTPNYAYTITKDKYFLLCGIFEVKNASDNFEKLKQSLHKDFSSPIKREACLVFKPSKMSEFCTGKDGIFLIGEAAGFVSPSSFEGISYAIESAVKLAETLNSNKLNKNKFYNKKTLPIKLKLLKKSVKAKIIFSPFLRKIIMKLGINSIKIVKKP